MIKCLSTTEQLLGVELSDEELEYPAGGPPKAMLSFNAKIRANGVEIGNVGVIAENSLDAVVLAIKKALPRWPADAYPDGLSVKVERIGSRT